MSYEIKPNAMRMRKIVFEGFLLDQFKDSAVCSDDNKMLISFLVYNVRKG